MEIGRVSLTTSLIFATCCISVLLASPLEPGVFIVPINFTGGVERSIMLSKNIFKHTNISIAFQGTLDESVTFSIDWELRFTECDEYFSEFEVLFGDFSLMFDAEHYIRVTHNESDYTAQSRFVQNNTFPQCYVLDRKLSECMKGTLYKDTQDPAEANKDTVEDDKEPQDPNKDPAEANKDTVENDKEPQDPNKDPAEANKEPEDPNKEAKDPNKDPAETNQRKKRDGSNDNKDPADTNKDLTDTDKESTDANKDSTDAKTNPVDHDKYVITKSDGSGRYVLMIRVFNIKIDRKAPPQMMNWKIEFKSERGYLSAAEYPLLQFYGLMCGAYSILAFIWIFLLCYQYQELLGIQVWIGGVIILGLIEKAVFLAEYEHLNNIGTTTSGGIVVAELVSCVKRTLARLLVVVVSIGYGITRPRLGNDLNYILSAGFLYFVLSSAEAIMRVNGTADHSMVALLPLSVLDAILVWWIFRNLVDTTRTLRLRENETKLWLYRHFTNTLILCIVLSIIFICWSFKNHRFIICLQKWQELWLDDGFWHILFCIILVVVMILFRPTANNQRYAYTVLLDDEEDEERKDPLLSEAYDGMKMRNVRKDKTEDVVADIADDLKWVEDNIPAAIADTALAAFDDSEEELVTNLERSKMD